jgi:putative ABC transport system substrate-binding protein
MTRVSVAAVLALGLLATPLAAEGQPPAKVSRIGILRSGSAPDPLVDAFRQGLRELGYDEGRNISIEYRWAEGRDARLPDLATDLVRLQVDVIVAAGQAPALAGLTGLGDELAGKRMQLLKETFPRVSRAAALWEPAGSAEMVRASETAARALGIRLRTLRVGRPDDLASAFAEAQQDRADALFVLPSGFFYAQRARLVELAAKHRLPTMYDQKEFVVGSGGLMSYGANFHDLFRRAAGYVDKILKGAKPADLPVEQPTKYELAINLRTAKALGLTIPPAVLARADEVIE